MLFKGTVTPQPPRLGAFAGSAVLHGVPIVLLMLLPASGPVDTAASVHRKYSVSYLLPLTQRARTASLARQPAGARAHHPFQMPARFSILSIKQTVAQLETPPEIVWQREALQAMQPWQPPSVDGPPVAPERNESPKVARSRPTTVVLSPHKAGLSVAQVKLAAEVLNGAPDLTHPSAVVPPISATAEEPAPGIPQFGLPDLDQTAAEPLVSLATNPLLLASLIVVSPFNQIVPSNAPSAEMWLRQGGANGDRHDGLDTAEGGRLGGSAPGSGTGATSGTGSGSSGTTGGASSGIGTRSYIMAGYTQINLPKDGKFDVAMVSSAASAAYPGSEGALSGDVVYTVYPRLGLRKNWILQYCLPKSRDHTASSRITNPHDMPWPFQMMRPDWLNADLDYIIIHGMLTSRGQLDQLAMVTPQRLQGKDSLIESLKLWTFRPAFRDGEPVAVEVLLIIPRQPE